MPWPLIGFVAAGFFSGSILYSLILPKWIKGVDIVAVSDDHNPGTANAMKYAGKLVGSLCLICDLGKGFFPVWIAAQFLPVGAFSFALVMAAPVMGHAFSPMLRGRGGKAIAATFGVLLGLLPLHLLLSGGGDPAPPAADHLDLYSVCGGVSAFLQGGVHRDRVRCHFGGGALPASFPGSRRSGAGAGGFGKEDSLISGDFCNNPLRNRRKCGIL